MTVRQRSMIWGIVGLLLLAGTASGLAVLFSQAGTPSAAGAKPRSSAPAGPPPLPCLGYIDLENGVTALAPLHTGRVARVDVRETNVVKAGTVLLELESSQQKHRVEEARG